MTTMAGRKPCVSILGHLVSIPPLLERKKNKVNNLCVVVAFKMDGCVNEQKITQVISIF